jgi:hypothetical protein
MRFAAVLFLIVSIFFISHQVDAQVNYQTAIGARISSYTYFNASLKHFIDKKGAIEVIAGGNFRGRYRSHSVLGGAVLYQHHISISSRTTKGLNAYLGGGGLMSINLYRIGSNAIDFGGVLGGGLDFKVPALPLNFSADIYPGLAYSTKIRPIIFGGVAVRLVLN